MLFLSLLYFQHAQCQSTIAPDSIPKKKNTIFGKEKQRDLIDVGMLILGKNPDKRLDTTTTRAGQIHFSGAPSPSYSLATGWTLYLSGNFAFYTGEFADENISSVYLSPLITVKHQFAVPIIFSIWTKDNKYNIIGDWRFLAYPEDTYGLGGLTKASDAVSMNYNYVRSYSFAMRKVAYDFYAGLGYQFDKHWNIQQLGLPADTVTPYTQYGGGTESLSSGLSAAFLFDNRRNLLNPAAGTSYGNIVLRQNLRALGSDGNWTSLLIDLRKYIRLSDHSKNVLALWSYNFFTLSGKPPYMDLPSTGWDTYSNTGRGYIQSRFRSLNMMDFEAEYRFGILANGLIGGVVFGNLATYSEYPGNRFEALLPGYGAGIRIKFNKFSKANICFDYAFGLHGSNGAFVNLGEVF